jgi:hypothetical protein
MADTQVQDTVPDIPAADTSGVERSIRDIIGRGVASWIGINAALCDFLVVGGLHLAAALTYNRVFTSSSPFLPMYVARRSHSPRPSVRWRRCRAATR